MRVSTHGEAYERNANDALAGSSLEKYARELCQIAWARVVREFPEQAAEMQHQAGKYGLWGTGFSKVTLGVDNATTAHCGREPDRTRACLVHSDGHSGRICGYESATCQPAGTAQPETGRSRNRKSLRNSAGVCAGSCGSTALTRRQRVQHAGATACREHFATGDGNTMRCACAAAGIAGQLCRQRNCRARL